MDTINIHQGWLRLGEVADDHETILLNGEPIAEELSYISGNVVTVRYYLSDKEATEEELTEDFLINTLYGDMKSDYGARYSEYTGYLWTDDELNIGGHDLLAELEGADGKFLYLIVELDQEKYETKQRQNNERYYFSNLRTVVRYAKELGKGTDEIISDLNELL